MRENNTEADRNGKRNNRGNAWCPKYRWSVNLSPPVLMTNNYDWAGSTQGGVTQRLQTETKGTCVKKEPAPLKATIEGGGGT
jgi:hypothetical protein